MTLYADISQPWLSGNTRIDALLGQFFHWQYETPSDSAIYYTFSTTAGNQDDGFHQPTNISSFNAAQQAAARQALAEAAQITGIQFVEVSDGNLADIHFANGDLADPNAAGQMTGQTDSFYGPDKILASYNANAYIYFDSNEYRDLFTNPSPGTQGYQILLREIGLALGLKNPHEGAITLAASEDNTGNTVMSFNWIGVPKSDYQAYDISALQWWYGTDGLGGVGYGGIQARTVSGSAFAERLDGGPGSDTLSGAEGNDTLNGGAGNDVMDGGPGVDSMDGGLGADTYFASTGDVITDAGGIDGVVADVSWTLASGLENLWVTGTLNLSAHGNDLDNELWGNAGDNLLKGGAGNDFLHDGPTGNDTFAGGTGTDVLLSFEGDDVFLFEEAPGAANADLIINFDIGANEIHLDASAHANLGAGGRLAVGDARFFAGPGATAGQDASDRVIYNTTTGELLHDPDGNGPASAQLIARLDPIVALGAGSIVVVNASNGQVINGTSGSDTLSGTSGNDSINGLGGDDLFLVGATGGVDVIDGGAGRDSIEFQGRATGAVVVDFAAGTITGGSSGTTSFANIERVVGSVFNDAMSGNAAGQTLTGYQGADSLWGAGGVDTLWGGAGADRFIFREAGSANADKISDWASASDKLVLDGSVMTMLGASGNFAADDARFVANSSGTATDANDRVIYQLDTRQVWYDADGSGAGAKVLIATLQSGATLVAADIVVEGEGGGGGQPINGTPGDDSLVGGPGDDTINGLAGNDVLVSGMGNDLVTGGAGSDVFFFWGDPDSGNVDQITDFAGGADKLRFNSGFFTDIGPSGNFAASDARFWSSAAGTAHDADDRVIYNTSTGQLFFDADGSGPGASLLLATLQGAPSLVAGDVSVDNETGSGGQVINGTAGADALSGTQGNDTINGLGGSDVFLAGSTGGNDVIDGGAGGDAIEFKERATSAIVADFAAGTITGGSTGTISFTNVERLVASDFSDSLTGNAVSQTLTGRAGADTLAGAGGVDTLWGGGGADTFVFREMGTANADRVSDFASGLDKLAVDDAAFSAIGAAGGFGVGDARFWSSASGMAHDADDRVIFDTSTGSLYYDADGNGSGAAQLIATVQSGATVVATDIVVI